MTTQFSRALPRNGFCARFSHPVLLALPAALSAGLAHPAAAQTVISTNHYSVLNLGNYGAGPLGITAGTTIAPATGTAIEGLSGSWSLDNAGDIQAPGIGIDLSAGAIDNAASGVISASTYGIFITGPGSVDNAGLISSSAIGVSLGDGGALTNTGTVSGQHIGVYTAGAAASIANAGLISAATGDAVSLYGGGVLANAASGRLTGGYSGVYANGHDSAISNAGLISGTHFGAYLTGTGLVNNSGVITGGLSGVVETGSGTLINTGTLIGTTKFGARLAAGSELDNSGVISGGVDGVTLGAGGSLTNEAGGLIEGADIGVRAGANATLHNAGTILDSFTAGMVLSSGDVLTNTGSIAGVTGILVTGSGASILDTGVIASSVDGGDAIAFQGDDSLTLGTGAILSGAIDGGDSASDILLTGTGTLASAVRNFGAGSALAITEGADWTASGNWTIAQVDNAGTFQPGIIGTPLDLTGSFVQTSTGVTRVLVSPTQTTEFSITGAAVLAGSLVYVLAPGAYAPGSEAFLTASGGITGAFSSVTTQSTPSVQPAPASQPPVVAEAQQAEAAQATAAPAVAAQAAQIAATPVVQPTGQSALGVVADGDVLGLSINRAFTVAPSDDTLYSATAQAAALSTTEVAGALLAHARGQNTGCAMPAPGQARNIATALAGGICAAGGWVEVSGGALRADGFSATHSGVLAGIGHDFAGGARLGFALGDDGTDLNDNTGGRSTLDTLRLGLYGAAPLGGFTLAGDVMEGFARTTTQRETGAGLARATANGTIFSAMLDVSRIYPVGAAMLTPSAGLAIASLNLGRFSETARNAAFAVTARAGGTLAQPYLRLALARDVVTATGLTVAPSLALGLSYGARMPDAQSLTAADGTAFSASAAHLTAAAGQFAAGLSAGRGNWSASLRGTAQISGNWSAAGVEAAVEVKF